MLSVFAGVLFQICLPMIASLVAGKFLYKKNITAWNILFFLCFYITLLQCIKTIFGEGVYTLVRSLGENGNSTYTHYALPLLFISITVPKMVDKIDSSFGKDEFYSERSFVSSFFWTYIAAYTAGVLFYNFSGVICVVLFLFMLMLGRLLPDKMQTFNLNNGIGYIKTCIQKYLPIILFFSFTFHVFIPLQVIISNKEEICIGFIPTILTSFMLFLVFSIVTLSIAALLSSEAINKGTFIVLFAFSVMSYIQQNFLNGYMTELDGIAQSWPAEICKANLIIWIILILIIISGGLICHERMHKVMCTISIFVFLVEIVTVFSISIMSADYWFSDRRIITTDNIFNLAPKNNTIVFILDKYDEQIIEGIVDKNPDFIKPLDGFTWYKNQTSRYGFTYMSVPYLLTGVEWKKFEESEYADRANKDGDFLKRISNAGYDIDIYTESQHVKDYDHIVENFRDISWKNINYIYLSKVIGKISRYQSFPYAVKAQHYYTSTDINESADEDVFYSYRNVKYFRSFERNGLNISDKYNKGTFKCYHIQGVHDLAWTSNLESVEAGSVDASECGIGVMKIVYEYLEQLKQVDLYDSSYIIITADHGYYGMMDENDEKDLFNAAAPLLFVKERDSRGEIQVSSAPVSHDDFFGSVLNAMNIDRTGYDTAYEEIPEDCDRIRTYEIYFKNDELGRYEKYKIDGVVTNSASWLRTETEYVEK